MNTDRCVDFRFLNPGAETVVTAVARSVLTVTVVIGTTRQWSVMQPAVYVTDPANWTSIDQLVN